MHIIWLLTATAGVSSRIMAWMKQDNTLQHTVNHRRSSDQNSKQANLIFSFASSATDTNRMLPEGKDLCAFFLMAEANWSIPEKLSRRNHLGESRQEGQQSHEQSGKHSLPETHLLEPNGWDHSNIYNTDCWIKSQAKRPEKEDKHYFKAEIKYNSNFTCKQILPIVLPGGANDFTSCRTPKYYRFVHGLHCDYDCKNIYRFFSQKTLAIKLIHRLDTS